MVNDRPSKKRSLELEGPEDLERGTATNEGTIPILIQVPELSSNCVVLGKYNSNKQYTPLTKATRIYKEYRNIIPRKTTGYNPTELENVRAGLTTHTRGQLGLSYMPPIQFVVDVEKIKNLNDVKQRAVWNAKPQLFQHKLADGLVLTFVEDKTNHFLEQDLMQNNRKEVTSAPAPAPAIPIRPRAPPIALHRDVPGPFDTSNGVFKGSWHAGGPAPSPHLPGTSTGPAPPPYLYDGPAPSPYLPGTSTGPAPPPYLYGASTLPGGSDAMQLADGAGNASCRSLLLMDVGSHASPHSFHTNMSTLLPNGFFGGLLRPSADPAHKKGTTVNPGPKTYGPEEVMVFQFDPAGNELGQQVDTFCGLWLQDKQDATNPRVTIRKGDMIKEFWTHFKSCKQQLPQLLKPFDDSPLPMLRNLKEKFLIDLVTAMLNGMTKAYDQHPDSCLDGEAHAWATTIPKFLDSWSGSEPSSMTSDPHSLHTSDESPTEAASNLTTMAFPGQMRVAESNVNERESPPFECKTSQSPFGVSLSGAILQEPSSVQGTGIPSLIAPVPETEAEMVDGAQLLEAPPSGVLLSRAILQEPSSGPQTGTLSLIDTLPEAEAEMVDGAELLEATLVDTLHNLRNNQVLVLVLLVVALLAVIATAILVPLFLWANGDDGRSSGIGQKLCLRNSTEPFLSTLRPSLIKDITKDPCSSQARANVWMLNDPHLHNYTEDRQIQRFMMVSIWYSLNAENTWERSDNWLNYSFSECEWYTAQPNQTVCDDANVLRVLNLTGNGLMGSIPSEALTLIKARVVDLSRNGLAGEIPPMTKEVAETVEHVDFSYNNLEGQFHVEFGVRGMSLRYFNLRNNQFTGAIPVQNLASPDLVYLDVTNNKLEGKMPTMLGAVSNLEVVLLGGNSLSGTIPDIGMFHRLKRVDMSGNSLSGTIPAAVGNLQELRSIDLSGNAQFRGTIPSAMGSLPHLEWANVKGTNMFGSIPSVLCEKQKAGLLELDADCDKDGGIQCCPP